MIGKDGLWKGIIEDLADDLLRFFFPEQVGLIDWERGIEFLDKELQQLFPESDGHDRHADKLFKVWLKSGEEQWFLVHVEVQGYPDPDFARRMYEYFYRIEARYGRPVTALAIYTDTDRRCHFKEYHYSFWGTELHYQFNTFVLMDHPSEELAEMDNIFAIVMEAAWQGLNDGKWDQKALLNAKLNLARKLYKKGYKAILVNGLDVYHHAQHDMKTFFSRAWLHGQNKYHINQENLANVFSDRNKFFARKSKWTYKSLAALYIGTTQVSYVRESVKMRMKKNLRTDLE